MTGVQQLSDTDPGVQDWATGQPDGAEGQTAFVLGNLAVVRPAEGEAILYTSGIALNAGVGLESYAFFQAPDLIEYRAGEYLDFDTSSPSLGIPGTITSKRVILERRRGYGRDPVGTGRGLRP